MLEWWRSINDGVVEKYLCWSGGEVLMFEWWRSINVGVVEKY